MPRVFPHQLIGCSRVKEGLKQNVDQHPGCLCSGVCGNMVSGKGSHWMRDLYDNVWGLLLSTLAPGRSEYDSKNVIFNLVLLIGIFRSSHDNALR